MTHLRELWKKTMKQFWCTLPTFSARQVRNCSSKRENRVIRKGGEHERNFQMIA